jgi:hypothetical protein
MSEAETKQMSGSLEKLPASASDLATDPGPAPALAMKGQARATADADRAALETKAARLEQQGHADSRVPLGEDQIEASIAAEELTAQARAGGAAPDAALPTIEAAAPSEEVGIIAKEQHGTEIDAALTKASADVTAERGKHANEEEKARADADRQVRDLKTKADADHAAAKAKAKAEAEQARGEWQAEIDKKGAAARKQADKKVAEGMAQVEAEETKANAEAKQHIEDGQRKAEEEKQKGEREAADAKAKGKQKSSGFRGWLSSKAKAFFDGIKKAISAAIDAARKAVKAVIDAAKKLAMAAIELARKAITAAIRAIGDALLAISEVLLAAFPELKARFQATIRKAVAAATAAVDKIAAGLKQAVQQALDLLGAALDKALGLLEKGLHAIVAVVGAVLQGFIDAAQAIALALGTWARLLKDIASGPGAWLGKLGAAIVDGIKHHLWAALKTAVIEWFKSKVFELLGVAGLVLQVLLEGGITQDDIVQMALDALIVAIPAALIAILIEKLVAMIVPAAGALMAIIEGLQAAWGTISRIIAAFAAFMAFLLAVQSGGAGPLFATALAAAAVVLLDFVANWLLRKLRGPAARVGARLKGMAAKLGRRGKGKGPRGQDATPGAKPPKRQRTDGDGPDGKPTKQPDKDKKQDVRDARRIAQDTARRAWDLARRRTNNEIVSVAALESAIRGVEGTRRGFRVTVDVIVNGRSWNIRAHATKGSASGMATKGRGWVALDGGTRWLAAKDQTRKHDGIVRDADRLLDVEARKLSKQHGQLRDLHQALRPRIQKIERMLTERLLKGIRFTINENEYTEGKDEHGDAALLYSWEIRPNASKNRIAASGGKKRGDHVFAHGLTKLPAELHRIASTKELIGSKARLEAAISSISSSVSHSAFELVVQKPEVAGKEGDTQSQAFGGALSGFRAVFETFLDKLELLDLAVALETSPVDEVVAAQAAQAALVSQWASLIDTVHDRDCTPHLDNKGKGLERQGVTTLRTLKTSFPQALSAVVAAAARLQAKEAAPAASEAKSSGSVTPEGKTPDGKTPDSKSSDGKAPDGKEDGS